MPGLDELTATEAAAELAAGRASAESLTRACLDRIAARDADVQAWEHLDDDRAIEQARALDRAREDGRGTGPLHGLSVGIKDIIDTADMPTQHGSPIFRGRQPGRDAACVAALRDAGAVILGKTVTTELANRHPGRTRNPHDLGHTPGGSSSGSAAAVADRQVHLALGTQTGGSVIRPGSFCGTHALKPTLGLIARDGVLMQSHTLDTVGVFGRSVDDLALVTDCLSARDPSDPTSFERSRASLLELSREPPPARPRLAFVRTPAWPEAEPAARSALESFVEALGERCEPASLPAPFDAVHDLHATVMAAEDLAYYGEHLAATPELLSDELRARLEAARSIAAADYVRALVARDAIYAGVEALLSRHDAIVCLASAGPAPAGFATTGTAIFNGLWTYLGVPCVTLPLLAVGGLPMGVQLVGRRREDGRLLRTARWLESAARDGAA